MVCRPVAIPTNIWALHKVEKLRCHVWCHEVYFFAREQSSKIILCSPPNRSVVRKCQQVWKPPLLSSNRIRLANGQHVIYLFWYIPIYICVCVCMYRSYIILHIHILHSLRKHERSYPQEWKQAEIRIQHGGIPRGFNGQIISQWNGKSLPIWISSGKPLHMENQPFI